jgi:hypothetical protein
MQMNERNVKKMIGLKECPNPECGYKSPKFVNTNMYHAANIWCPVCSLEGPQAKTDDSRVVRIDALKDSERDTQERAYSQELAGEAARLWNALPREPKPSAGPFISAEAMDLKSTEHAIRQELVNLCFDIGLMISTPGDGKDGKPYDLTKWTQEEKAEWIAKQLRGCGFNTKPVGSSWGVLSPNSPSLYARK